MSSSVNKPTSEDSKSFLPCSMSSLKKDVLCSSTKETENECPPVNSSVVHKKSKSCLIYPLKKNPAKGIKSNLIKTNNSNSSIQINSPATNAISVNQKRKCNLLETENKSSVPKSNSSIKRKSLMPIEVASTKKDQGNSCKQRNKKSAIEIVSCAAEASVSSITICPSNMNEIGFDKNNRCKTWSKNIHQPTQQKIQFVFANKVGNFVSLPKFTPGILLPKVVLKRLPDAITEACMKKGYIILRKLSQISVSSTIEDIEIEEKKIRI
ncbi:hypothetical protein TNCT_116801 [Trichonephila clavata]|uniref:Uncharacterized protein n=1 Tax=Trichonephila clavata TaxID=2740835 RepID=A0A8X6HX98_TRICU|nr:hypothetical protein TNCT_116801 [Trichonephila clavata]